MSSSRVVTLTADNFDTIALAADRTVVVDFWASWCPPCRALAPAIEALAEERTDIVVGKLDVDDHSAITERYGIQSIPTVLVFRDGKLASRSVGLVPIERLRELVDRTVEATA
ncbi:MAG TPA: thioredoxin [Vicinamibacteria bacterium]